MTALLLDTGPLFAYLSRKDEYHVWAVKQFAAIQGALLTCEPVLTEVAHLISRNGGNADGLWSFLRRGTIQIGLRVDLEFESIAVLMSRYSNVPMDLADACLVRMSELTRDCRLLTTDGDFKIYRRFGRQVIPLVVPN